MNRGLTSFRALAFLAVFAVHSGLFSLGYLGVQAFFVLSGFLLTPILVNMKDNLPVKSFFINFYGRRILRIFPLYYFYLLVILLLCLLVINMEGYGWLEEIGTFLQQAPWAFTYTYDFFHASAYFGSANPLVSHFWSLAVEEQFYLIWPILIFLVERKHLKNLLLTTIVVGPILRALTALAVQNSIFPILGQQADLVIYVLPFSHFDAFAIGGYFALYGASQRSNIPTLLLLFGSVPLGYLTQYLSTGEINIISLGYSTFLRDQYIWGYSLFNLIFAKMIIQIKDGVFFPSFFKNKILNYLGEISYGLYVYHLPILWFVNRFYPNIPEPIRIAIALSATILVSSMSYELFEKPFIRMKDKFFSKNDVNIPLNKKSPAFEG